MPNKTYTRKTVASGAWANPQDGGPSFLSETVTSLPGRTWHALCDGEVLTVVIDGGALSQSEIDALDAAYAAWDPDAPAPTAKYSPIFKVTTEQRGRAQKIEWFQTDSGGGVYTDLCKDEVYTWSGSTLISTTSREYHIDGSVVPGSTVITSYYTTTDGRKVEKVT